MNALALVAAAICAVILPGCSGGSGAEATTFGRRATLTVAPALGRFSQGTTVRARDRNGRLLAEAAVGADGLAVLAFTADGTSGPFIVEAGLEGDSYFDAKAGGPVVIAGLPPGTAALRALVPDLASARIGVTAITEIAAGLLMDRSGTLPPTADASTVIAANHLAGRQFGVADPLAPPSLLSADTTLDPRAQADDHALRLATLAYLAGPDMNALQVTQAMRDDMRDGVFDAQTGTGTPAVAAALPNLSAPASPDTLQASLQAAARAAQARWAAGSPAVTMAVPTANVHGAMQASIPHLRSTLADHARSSPAVRQAAVKLAFDVTQQAIAGLLPASGTLPGEVVNAAVTDFVSAFAVNGAIVVRLAMSQDIGLHVTTIADFDLDGAVEPFGFSNNGQGGLQPWRPDAITYRPGGETDGAGAGAGAADFDGNGVLDLMDDAYFDYRSALLVGELKAGVPAYREDAAFLAMDIHGFCETIIVADFNNDGFTDAFIPCYADTQTRASHPDIHSYLLINDGLGHFTDRAQEAGVAMIGELRPEGAQAVDFNGDGWIDLYAAGNLFLNNGDLSFTRANEAWQLPAIFDEGVEFLDFDNDGRLDLALWTPGDGVGLRLFRNTGSALEDQAVDLPRLATRSYTWGLTALDVNGDGWMDLVIPGDKALPNELLLNDHGHLRSLGTAGAVGVKLDRGAGGSVGDFNGDGLPDLYTRAGEVLINVSVPVSRCGLTVRLTDDQGRLNQHGRVVRVAADADPSMIMTRVVNGGSGQAAQNEYDIHLATPTCGRHSAQVTWAPGVSATMTVDTTNRPLLVLKPPR